MNQDILLALAKLHRQGQEVTLAKLKAAAIGRHPMPALIQAIKAYQADSEGILAQLPESPQPTPPEEDRLSQLERQVQELTARLAAVEAKLSRTS
ncbi:hypothetical protein [Ferrimonas futtsuensis]|uniref:hypothetical protein n=1 Tax=Ferrimonas futtsuensis TaxID=364764 RepID=UPI0003F9C4A9|nr:hypothetical protein [Ferrimonas futtsuensis]